MTDHGAQGVPRYLGRLEDARRLGGGLTGVAGVEQGGTVQHCGEMYAFEINPWPGRGHGRWVDAYLQ